MKLILKTKYTTVEKQLVHMLVVKNIDSNKNNNRKLELEQSIEAFKKWQYNVGNLNQDQV